jgi:hypothetical protein
MKSVRPTLQETVFLSLCAAILAWKLLLPGFIGMASNGDFGKIIGPLCMDGADHSADNFIFFQSGYLRGTEYCFPAPYFSSETALAWMASSAERKLGDPVRFDIRWIGTIHILLFLSFYFALLLFLRPVGMAARITMSLAGLWIFADIGLIAYLNSFFTDTAAILGGLTAVVWALHLSMAERIALIPLTLFGLAVLLFAVSKAQHAFLGVAPLAFLCWIAWRTAETHLRLATCLAALGVLCATVWIVASTPRSYTAQARFNLIFFYLVPNSRVPAQDLIELGLDPSDVRYSGLTAYSPSTPMNDANWRNAFNARTSYAGVFMFYLRHPARALSKLEFDLRNEAPNRRVLNLSNYRRDSGQPPGARDPQFGSWSALRTRLFRWWPTHIVVWLVLALSVPPFLAKRATSPFQRSVAWTIPAVALLAIAEFLTVSLADVIETARHLLMFHVFTDLTIFLSMVLGCGRPGGGRDRA